MPNFQYLFQFNKKKNNDWFQIILVQINMLQEGFK